MSGKRFVPFRYLVVVAAFLSLVCLGCQRGAENPEDVAETEEAADVADADPTTASSISTDSRTLATSSKVDAVTVSANSRQSIGPGHFNGHHESVVLSPDRLRWLDHEPSWTPLSSVPPRFGANGVTFVSLIDAETVLASEIPSSLPQNRWTRSQPKGDANGVASWIDLHTLSVVKSQRLTGGITASEFSPDGRTAVTATGERSVVLWDVDRQTPRQTLTGHQHAVQAAAFRPDGRQLASGDAAGMIILWDAATGKQVWSASLPETLVQPIKTSSNAELHSQPMTGAASAVGITSLAFSGDQRVLAAGTATGFTQSFELERGAPLSPVFHEFPVSDLAFADDDASMLVATRSGDVFRWWRAPDPPRVLSAHQGSVRFAALDASGRRAVTGGVDRQLRVWDVDQGSLVSSLDNGGEAITCGAISMDGERAVTCGYGSGVVFWDLKERQSLAKRYGHKQRVWSLAFSPDGETVASGSDDRTVRLWEFSTQKTIRTIELDAPVHFVRFSPDGTQLLTSTLDPRGWQFPVRLQLWSASTGKPLREFQKHRVAVNSAVFSPDGRELTSCGADGQVCRWRVETGECFSDTDRADGLSHAGLIHGGRSLVLRRFNTGIFIDHVETMTRLSEFDVPTRAIGDLNVAAQGDRVIVGTEEGPVYVWTIGRK